MPQIQINSDRMHPQLYRSWRAQGHSATSRRTIFPCLAIGVLCALHAPATLHAQDLSWSFTIGGTGYEEARGIAVAQDGRIYMTGEFEDTVNFAPGAAQSTMVSQGYSDAFLACYTNDGKLHHALSFAGTAKSQGYGVAIAPNGTVYTTGIFTGTVDLDPGPGMALYTSGGLYDAYLCALSPDGGLLWAGTIGGPGNEETRSVTTDAAGNLYIAGEMHGAFDADPGPDVYMVDTLGSFDAFVAKYGPDGSFQWAHAIGGTGDDRAYDAVARPDGSVFVTGYFADTMDVDPGAGVLQVAAHGQWSDAFLVHYDADGNLIWGTGMGGYGTDIGRGLALDSTGNVAITGRFAKTAYFRNGAGLDSLSCSGPDGDADIFLAKYGADGSLAWLRSIGGPDKNMPRGAAADREGNILVTGRTRGTVDLDAGPGTSLHTANGVFDAFLVKYGPQGDFIWGFTAGGTFHTRGLNVATDAVGSAYLTGWITEPFDIDPGPDSLLLTSAGSMDAYLAKFSDNGLHDLRLSVDLDNTPASTGWHIGGALGGPALFAGTADPSEAGQTIQRLWQVPEGCYRLSVTDTDGNGVDPGGYTLSADSVPLIIANGEFGSVSALANGEGFCLPTGAASLDPASCTQGVFTPDDDLLIQPVGGAGQYTIWIFDPHGTFSATSEVTSTIAPLFLLPNGTPNGLPLNIRVRAWVDGIPQSYGPACVIQFDGLTGITPPAASGESLSLYPNPAKEGQVWLGMDGLPDGAWPVELRDALGCLVAGRMAHIATGSVPCALPLPPLRAGVYTVVVQGLHGPLVQRLVVGG